MSPLETLILVLYFFVLSILAIYGWHRYYLVYVYMKHKGRAPLPMAPLAVLPPVTVQLPIFNEMYVADRLISTVCEMDYPRELLEIQVLDDSTDETTEIAELAVRRHASRGFDIRFLHRVDRRGYKAGALEAGMRQSSGEFVAIFDADVVSPAEVPVEMNSFKSQQHRWAKGSIQTCMKLLPRILRSKQPLSVKAEAFFHLSANFNYLLMSMLSILMFPAMWVRYNMGWTVMFIIDVPLFCAATASIGVFYVKAQRELYPDWRQRLKYLPFLMSIGIGLCVNNTRAVLEALFHKQSEFARTPKYGIERDSDEWAGKKYHQSVGVQPFIELGLGLYFTGTVYYALANQIYGTLPFLMLFQIGFLYTGLLSILQQFTGDDVMLKAPEVAK